MSQLQRFIGYTTAPALTAAAMLAGQAASADTQLPWCTWSHVTVTAGPPQAALTHWAVTLSFNLAPGAAKCSLAGFPRVDSDAGGPLLRAESTPRGYMGGVPEDIDYPQTITVAPGAPAHAVVEGDAVDGYPCPTYTALQVALPDATEAFTVPATIAACALQVHPVTA